MDKPFAITLDAGSSRANHTGAWRTGRPVYVHNLPPCNDACPADENVQQWLYHAEEGGEAAYEAAWRQIMEDTCRGGADGQAGAGGRCGPSGLSAAYHLTRMGHSVTVKDAGAEPGGMMRYGIPKYRLPRDVLDAEIDRLLGMGVTLELGRKITGILPELAENGGDFDAAFVAVGAHIGKRAYIPVGDSARIMDAVSMLHQVEDGSPPMLGRRVAVYGGGNTAMDAARTARRLGAAEAVVVYRRTRDRMPAHDIEVTETLEEGVSMRWLSTVTHADSGRLLIEKMRLDDIGFPQPTGEFEELAADCLVLALGQDTDLSVLHDVPGVTFSGGTVDVGPDLMTGHPGIFAGGDMVPAERTVTVAIGHGMKAAEHRRLAAHSYLPGGRPPGCTPDRKRSYRACEDSGLRRAQHLVLHRRPATVRPRLDAARRIGTFDEVTGGLDDSAALFEARRYMSCGICAAECPCGAIAMVPEQA